MPERKTLSLSKPAKPVASEGAEVVAPEVAALHPQDAAAQPVELPAKGTLLAFDFGLARIGVAVGEIETRLAQPLGAIAEEANAARFSAISALIQEWQPVYLVVGLPLDMAGERTAMTTRCRRFTNQLHGRFGLPVAVVDERLTSVAAESQLVAAGVEDWRARKGWVDSTAAQIILQQFLETHVKNEPKKRVTRRKKTDPVPE